MSDASQALAIELVIYFCAFAPMAVVTVLVLQRFVEGARGLLRAMGLWTTQLAATGRPDLVLSDNPLRGDLSPELRKLGEETRLLLVALEPSRSSAHAWADTKRAWWARGDASPDLDPTIGVRGELWAWLQGAEALLDSDIAESDRLEQATQAVRAALFSESEVDDRLDAIVRKLVAFDGQLRAYNDAPYRGAAPTVSAPVPSNDEEEETASPPPLVDDPAKIEEVLVAHDDKLRAVASRYADDASTQEDVHQELRLAVWKALPKFRGDASVRTYISRVAHYCAARLGRKRPRHLPETELVDDAPAPDDWLNDHEQRRALQAAVDELPAAQRDAIRLHLEGIAVPDIASRLGITEGNVYVRITRARKLLRAHFEAEPA